MKNMIRYALFSVLVLLSMGLYGLKIRAPQAEEGVQKKIDEIQLQLTGATFTSLHKAKEMIVQVKGIVNSSVYSGPQGSEQLGERWPYTELNRLLIALRKHIEGMTDGKAEAMAEYDALRASFNQYLIGACTEKLERIGNESYVKGRITKIKKLLTENSKTQFLMDLNEMTTNAMKLKIAVVELRVSAGLLREDEIMGGLTDEQKTKIGTAIKKYVLGLDGGEDMSIVGLIKNYIEWAHVVLKQADDKQKDAEKEAFTQLVDTVILPLCDEVENFARVFGTFVGERVYNGVQDALAEKIRVLRDEIAVAYQ